MTLWIVLTVLVSLAAVGLVIPLIRPRADAEAGATPVGILKDQLAELDAQVASGVVAEADAARLRVEIERRILVEARDAEPVGRPLGSRATLRLALGLAGVVAFSATLLYAVMGRPDVPGAARPAAALPSSETGDAAHPGGDVTAMVAQLKSLPLPQSPSARRLRSIRPSLALATSWRYARTSPVIATARWPTGSPSSTPPRPARPGPGR